MKEIIPNGTAKGFEVKKGAKVKISIPRGGQVADMAFPDFSQSLTRDLNAAGRKMIFHAEEGTIFYDGEGIAHLKLVESRGSSKHDLLFPGCRKEMYEGKLGCRDLLSEAIGIPRRELAGVCSFFMNVKRGEIYPSSARPGDYVVLEALRDLTLGISSCPDQGASPTLSEVVVEI
jgi:uncharacterized protein YcgI (DUF1989 family)